MSPPIKTDMSKDTHKIPRRMSRTKPTESLTSPVQSVRGPSPSSGIWGSEPYNGTIELQTGEIAEDITYYFAQSEQTPSAVSLGVLVDVDYSIRQSGGFIIQLMPGATDDTIGYLEQKLNGLDSLTALYEQGHTPESLAELLFADIGYEETDRTPVAFHCDCSRERARRVLLSMGKEELIKLKEEDHAAALNCQFCNREYRFDAGELDALIAKAAARKKN